MGEIVRVKHSEHGSCQVEILICTCTGGVPVYFLFFFFTLECKVLPSGLSCVVDLP